MKEIREDDMETVHGGVFFIATTLVLNIFVWAAIPATLACTQYRVDDNGEQILGERGEPVRHC